MDLGIAGELNVRRKVFNFISFPFLLDRNRLACVIP